MGFLWDVHGPFNWYLRSDFKFCKVICAKQIHMSFWVVHIKDTKISGISRGLKLLENGLIIKIECHISI